MELKKVEYEGESWYRHKDLADYLNISANSLYRVANKNGFVEADDMAAYRCAEVDQYLGLLATTIPTAEALPLISPSKGYAKKALTRAIRKGLVKSPKRGRIDRKSLTEWLSSRRNKP